MSKILIVDDSPTITTIYARFLGRAGYEVATAADGTTGLAQARTTRPDLILLDNVLPDVQGTEVCRRLKADPTMQGMKVLLLTGSHDAKLDQVGAEMVLLKDCGPARVLEAIHALLETRPS